MNRRQNLLSSATGLALLATVAVMPQPSRGGQTTQSFVLQPGWNAVYLEVRPDAEDLEAAFAGIPVASVWSWNPRTSPVEFIQDPAEGLLTTDGWQAYFPRPRPEAFLTNLFIIQANHAYLIKLDGGQPVTWVVPGTPSLRDQKWVTDSFNLVGFAVDPPAPPTFGSWLSGSPAHAGQPVYELGGDGVWTLIEQPWSTTIDSGRAYWVYCQGASTFQGPLSVELEGGDGLEYSAALTSQQLVIGNQTEVDVDITLRQLAAAAPVPLAYERTDPETSERSWPALPAALAISAAAGNEILVDLAVRRADLAGYRGEQVLEITNGLGSRRLVAVGVNAIQPVGVPASALSPAARKSLARGFHKVSSSYSGLWVGNALVGAVSEAQTGGTTPTPTGSEFPLRLIIHVDSGGQARLLKEVVQMWEEGTQAPHPDDPGLLTTDVPGRFVLITDEDLIPNYTGAGLRDGTPVGIRGSTTSYDFAGLHADMNGTFSPTGSLTATLVVAADFPTNPFKHRYHPDHDNLDAQFLNFRQEAYEVTREIELRFESTDPQGGNPPDWGDSLLGGRYLETITGIHRYAIYVAGTFRLKRISAVTVLNQ